MTDSNVVSIIGRLTNDCEVTRVTNGNLYGRFSIAVNHSYQYNGEWHDETSFFDCSMFGDICSMKGPYLQKGKRISVIGSLRQARWEKDGKKCSKVEIRVNQIQILETPGNPKKAEDNNVSQTIAPEAMPETSEPYMEEEMPF